ncbi:hypothetical protein L1987_00329 [Smallanthus sonchifolius]|uniref:Uncharacterized protein n=1 Tax=Smallanthus sonchifolius TaxID=185202 RepID=A0ACB9K219_9ASTR|nr:hypothetical protein L1987_00329 [Smallanthus sonchifolius]
MIKKDSIEGSKEIFKRAYNFAYLLHTYLKPNVAILDGITMGGGAAISIAGNLGLQLYYLVFVYAESDVFFGCFEDIPGMLLREQN